MVTYSKELGMSRKYLLFIYLLGIGQLNETLRASAGRGYRPPKKRKAPIITGARRRPSIPSPLESIIPLENLLAIAFFGFPSTQGIRPPLGQMKFEKTLRV